MHKVGNKIECNNMHGERIKTMTDYLPVDTDKHPESYILRDSDI